MKSRKLFDAGAAGSPAAMISATCLVAASFIGCPLLKKKAAEEADASAAAPPPGAATVTMSGTGAKNEANVLRYATETPLSNEPAVIGKDNTPARNFPGNGPVVANLAKGVPVAKIAQYFSTGTLVMFDDPSGDGSKLIGWVTPTAFDITAPAPTKIVVVPPRDAGGAVAIKDAGAAPVDGGSKTSTTDAGSNNNSGIVFPKGLVSYAPIEGKCGEGYALTQGMCRKKCAADSECGRGLKCVNKGGTKVCSTG